MISTTRSRFALAFQFWEKIPTTRVESVRMLICLCVLPAPRQAGTQTGGRAGKELLFKLSKGVLEGEEFCLVVRDVPERDSVQGEDLITGADHDSCSSGSRVSFAGAVDVDVDHGFTYFLR